MPDATPLEFPDSLEWVSTPDGHQLSLRIIGQGESARTRAAVLCLHGIFSDGRFFLNTRQRGPASAFLKRGYQVYVGELRGHGRSKLPPASRKWNWSFDEYVSQDIPALVNAVAERHDGPLFVLAHSMGGYALLASLGLDPELHAKVSGVCLAASAVNDYTEMGLRKRLLFHFASGLGGVLGYFPARRLRLGVADEPAALMAQFARWAPERRFTSMNGNVDYWQCLRRVTLPVWAGVGTADKFHASVSRGMALVDRLGSTDKQFVELGTKSGFSQEFDHAGVLRGAAAEQEVLPQMAAWMEARAAGCPRGKT